MCLSDLRAPDAHRERVIWETGMVWLGVEEGRCGCYEVMMLKLAADFCIASRDIICLQLHKALWYLVMIQREGR